MAEDPVRLDGLGYEAGGQAILSGITLHSGAQKIGVVGRNGSGKSTLSRLMAGLLKPASGTVRIEGVDVYADRRAALRTVGILFQNPEHQIIFPTVGEEIAFGLRQLGATAAEAQEQTRATLLRFDRAHWLDAPVSALSQGQKHLVCMMAVLAMQPRLLILDEPFAGLDIPTKRQLARHLDRSGARLFHISHDPADLAGYDQLYWLEQGRIIAEGPPAVLLPEFTAEMMRLGDQDDLADISA
ncbi:energy-coupling factor ABC transporter ATP-binding protein [Paracoccus sulfuroxidans]|uniref:energy-coupling factor ABC transporter ATP-binding protein n=1 Tax=Paracoccus sulfuroxidans TaxID=384678 RepID=UPI001F554A41|nr:ABC transporter ATP-binding protein [Paracoccus sulfuroxidans]